MKIALFFDGKNFYSGWREKAPGRRLSFPRLSRWLVEKAGGSLLVGAHYYTGIETGDEAKEDGARKLKGFLDMLEVQPGFFVYRFPRKARSVRCSTCQAENRFTQEKEVDTTMVADMLRLAAVNAFDAVVLVSGDADHAPAVEGVRVLGKLAFAASWGGSGMSSRIRQAAFDHIDLLGGLLEFEDVTPPPPVAPAPAPPAPPAPVNPLTPSLIVPAHPMTDEAFLAELAAAEQKFAPSGGYVGVNYFVMSWKSTRLNENAHERRRIMDRLIELGKVEIYDAKGTKALRVRK